MASARTVAARCGISPGTLTYHFPTVDSLLVAALREASVGFTRAATEAASAREGARERIMSLIDTALPSTPDSRRNWKLWMEYWARASHVVELSELHSERYADWRAAFADIISSGVEDRELREVDPMSAALTIVALLDGLGLQAAIGDQRVDLATARALLAAHVDSLMA